MPRLDTRLIFSAAAPAQRPLWVNAAVAVGILAALPILPIVAILVLIGPGSIGVLPHVPDVAGSPRLTRGAFVLVMLGWLVIGLVVAVAVPRLGAVLGIGLFVLVPLFLYAWSWDRTLLSMLPSGFDDLSPSALAVLSMFSVPLAIGGLSVILTPLIPGGSVVWLALFGLGVFVTPFAVLLAYRRFPEQVAYLVRLGVILACVGVAVMFARA